MKFEQVLALVQAVSDSNVTTFKYEEGDVKLTLRTGEDSTVAVPQWMPVGNGNADQIPYGNIDTKEVQETVEIAEASVASGNAVTCPLVGTFYTAASEDAEPFVKVGDQVKKGQTLAIVEAMKLMNEIESEFDGEVVEILAENAVGVEYGQPLFVIR